VRSLVGAIPLIAVEVLDSGQVDKLPGFKKRMNWFLENRKDLARQLSFMERGRDVKTLLALPTRDRLVRVLRYLLDENEFLSPYGLRSISRVHKDRPYVLAVNGEEFRVDYDPAESTTAVRRQFELAWADLFPDQFPDRRGARAVPPLLRRLAEGRLPTGSGNLMTLREVARELSSRLAKIFLADGSGRRPVHADDARYKDDPHWKELVLFYEYFHGETGRGVGASHQTGGPRPSRSSSRIWRRRAKVAILRSRHLP